jgi:hypothetical protein
MYQDGKVPQMTTAAAAADDYAGMESGYGGSGTGKNIFENFQLSNFEHLFSKKIFYSFCREV